ncbi:RraA family protein [Pseudonocardiaceae bacterium YIM PH 21723]|nr:RraA family protein [Pseudonocardiaceae bacterium YIM PH 21723]
MIELRGVDTTGICDADKTVRVLHSALRLRSARADIAAPAFTVRCAGDLFPVARAIDAAEPGEVLVVDGEAREIAYAGEIFAKAALDKGLAGIVVDGGYRDMGYVTSCELPVYSRFVTPMAGTANRLGELQVPVTCGGVTVSPGEVLIADREGMIVLDPARVDPLIARAREIKDVEDRVLAALDSGSSLADCVNLAEHTAAMERGEASALRFTV